MIIKGLLIGIGALAALLFAADQIGGEIGRLAEDTQDYPSCDNCMGSIDSEICRFCRDGSCWEHKHEVLHTNSEV